ncbi:beta-lactamase [Verrucomicrobiia bacterium DG1235]|nr:beta-lactamase [Verrucomicrobiae bacterium DG1235]
MPNTRFSFALAVLLLANSLLAQASPEDLSPDLSKALEKSELPSIAAALVVEDRIVAAGASGLRKIGDTTPVTLDDKYHLGSCTKMMTATLAAILVEEGIIEWQTTIHEALSNTTETIHPDYHDVTLEQLLAHVGGFPGKAPPNLWLQAWTQQGKISPLEQRAAFCSGLLSLPPRYTPGTLTEYSNQGYAMAGHMMEVLAQKPWEDLIRERIFEPLQMNSAGFRAPASPDTLDQPWGHQNTTPVAPEPRGDNPDAIGPAGTVHASIADWAKFARFHLLRRTGTLLKNPASFDKLHSLLPNSGKHGVGGWLVHDIETFGGHCLQMVGSNTMWLSLIWILPEKDIAVVVATNSAGKDAFPTCDRVAGKLIRQYSKN